VEGSVNIGVSALGGGRSDDLQVAAMGTMVREDVTVRVGKAGHQLWKAFALIGRGWAI